MSEAKRQAAANGSARKPASKRAAWGGGALWIALAAVSLTSLAAVVEPGQLSAVARTTVTTLLEIGEEKPGRDLAHMTERLSVENDELRSRIAALEAAMSGPTGAIHPAAATMESPAEETVGRSRFGVDVGPIGALDAVAEQWRALAVRHASIADLVPTAALSERPDGGLELRLVAGPFDNASDAATLCARIDAAGTTCRTTLYSGRRLVFP